MKKTIKMIVTIALLISLLVLATNVFAVAPTSISSNIDGADVTAFNNLGGNIVKALQMIGSFVAIAVLIVLGIKYMMGSAEEKAEYKKTMLPYFIGAVFIFAAVNIAQFIFNFASSNVTV